MLLCYKKKNSFLSYSFPGFSLFWQNYWLEDMEQSEHVTLVIAIIVFKVIDILLTKIYFLYNFPQVLNILITVIVINDIIWSIGEYFKITIATSEPEIIIHLIHTILMDHVLYFHLRTSKKNFRYKFLRIIRFF